MIVARVDPTRARVRVDDARARTRTCSTPGSLVAVAVLDAGLARGDRGPRALLPDRRCWSPAADIIFFWVARMIMAGLEFMGEVPVPARVPHQHRARRAGPEDVEVARQLARPARRHRPVRRRRAALHDRLAGAGRAGRAASTREDASSSRQFFANKIWNAARFALMNSATAPSSRAPAARHPRERLALPDRWILSRLQTRDRRDARGDFEAYRFNDAATTLYRFIWGEFCDWYLELSSRALRRRRGGEARRRGARWSRCSIRRMRLLHPFMPFVTEEIWQALPIAAADGVDHDRAVSAGERRAGATPRRRRAIGQMIEAVTAIRNIRAELGIAPSTPR